MCVYILIDLATQTSKTHRPHEIQVPHMMFTESIYWIKNYLKNVGLHHLPAEVLDTVPAVLYTKCHP